MFVYDLLKNDVLRTANEIYTILNYDDARVFFRNAEEDLYEILLINADLKEKSPFNEVAGLEAFEYLNFFRKIA